ncbi:ABC transporter permease [Paractinoplanes rishiriensis]|uniref:Nitrate ABC transporter permease n=1 Tax=Paractinoplanes rishiriensis TaxID=1050105 RepID=A0A919JZ57_9ACTN|nr:ABC transporter permease [Actinoplanes rishiriensis]GIE96374.1 nitrate ABC transporter permease [Actinoplanes rishiriensis]
MIRFLGRVGVALALPAVLLVTWWFASAGSTSFYQPPLERIIEVFPDTWTAERLQSDVLPSVLRLLTGYGIAVFTGILLGVLIGANPRLRALLEPTLEFLRAIPPPVLVPILVLIAGLGNPTKVLVIVVGGVWPVLLNTVEGVRGVDEVLADTCRSYRIGGWLRMRTFVLRAASPQIIVGARQALSISIIMMVIGELLGATNGLGYTVVEFQRGFQIPEMWSGVFVLGLLGVLLSLAFTLVERRVLNWYHGARAAERSGH